MASTGLLSLGSLFLLCFFQEDGEVRAIKVAEAAFDAILDPDWAGQTVPLLVHLFGEIIDFLRAVSDTKTTTLAKFLNDRGRHSSKPSFGGGKPPEKSCIQNIIRAILPPPFLKGQGKNQSPFSFLHPGEK
jgi:hypothetical protein